MSAAVISEPMAAGSKRDDVPGPLDIMRPVQRAQARLGAVQRGRVVLVAAAFGLLVALVASLSMTAMSATTVGVGCLVITWGVSTLPAWWLLQRRTRTPSLVEVALWIEESRPHGASPDFSLVTCVELLAASEVPSTSLLRAAQRVLHGAALDQAMAARRTHAWRGPLLFVLAAAAMLVWAALRPADDHARAADVMARRNGADGSNVVPPLGMWQVRVIPPAYTGQGARSVGDVTTVVALTGSRIELRGDGPAPSVQEQRVADSVRVSRTAIQRDGTWSTGTVADTRPTSLTLERGGRSRLLVIEGHPDSIPTVMLQQPARDSVFREPKGRLPLLAVARDDIGIASAQFELIVTSGEGERFTVRTVTLGAATWPRGAARTGRIAGTLDLEALKLQAGDVVHLRAIARDAHPGASREVGSSETRAFRIARPSEMDSVAVEPAPPPEVDKSLLSQRMLLMLTEKLDKAQVRMPRPDVLRESLKLARDQARLRLAVGDVVFQRLSGESSAEHAHYAGDGHEHGVDQQGGKLSMSTSATTGMLEEGNDSPVVAINQPLLEAYNAMWDAGRALEQGDPHAAIPPMKRALEAIERSRAASRLYLRGRPPQVIVDIAKVRLAGKDTGQVTSRSTRNALPARAAARDARLVTAAQMIASGAGDRRVDAARDSLALLRVESLGDAPAFAAAIARVLTVLERGGDATASLVEARRVLGNVERTTVVPWSRGVPR